jgi:hypothetical protein
MLVYSFQSGQDSEVYGFTLDSSGSNLPALYAPWHAHGTHDINPNDGPRIGVSSSDILGGIQRDGYYLVRVKISVSVIVPGGAP